MAGASNIYSDEKREWMRAYTALGEKVITIFLFLFNIVPESIFNSFSFFQNKKYFIISQPKRWTICLFVVSDGRVKKIVRDLDSDMCVDVTNKVVRTL